MKETKLTQKSRFPVFLQKTYDLVTLGLSSAKAEQ